tara:strand:- start:295 stop:795 length:501 start_codon:yes stop_codon:yes gene_type:complete
MKKFGFLKEGGAANRYGNEDRLQNRDDGRERELREEEELEEEELKELATGAAGNPTGGSKRDDKDELEEIVGHPTILLKRDDDKEELEEEPIDEYYAKSDGGSPVSKRDDKEELEEENLEELRPFKKRDDEKKKEESKVRISPGLMEIVQKILKNNKKIMEKLKDK